MVESVAAESAGITGGHTRLKDSILVVSIGRHTRLGDILEIALEGIQFHIMEADKIETSDCRDSRVLFAASADPAGENPQMRSLAARMIRGELRMDGAVCAAIADGEQGGTVRTDALKLLLAANSAGAEILPRALLETDKDLRALAGAGRGQTSFDRYCCLAREMTQRLDSYRPVETGVEIQLELSLEDGLAQDWKTALQRLIKKSGVRGDSGKTDREILLFTENTTGLPDGRALARPGRERGRLTCLIASPAGGDLYPLALLDQVFARTDCAIAPEGMCVFEGLSAAEVLAYKPEMERLKILLEQRFAG